MSLNFSGTFVGPHVIGSIVSFMIRIRDDNVVRQRPVRDGCIARTYTLPELSRFSMSAAAMSENDAMIEYDDYN